MAVILSDSICEHLPIAGDVELYMQRDATIPSLCCKIQDDPGILYGAKCVIIHVGTNDIDNGVQTEDVCLGLIQLREYIQGLVPGAKVVLSGMIPRMDKPHVQERVKLTNKLMRKKLGAAFLLPRRFLDKDNQIIRDYFSDDGLHLSDKGGEALWATYYNVLRRA